ncbi:MAG: arginine--tRNA ligase [Candidatus Moraniibacteriota bacterium]
MKSQIQQIIKNALIEAKKVNDWPAFPADGSDFELSEIIIDYPKNEQFGDYSSNIAMVLARKLGKSPMEIANQIAELLNCDIAESCHPELVSGSALQENTGETNPKMLKQVQPDIYGAFEKVEVAAPGYLNFHLSKKYLQSVVEKITKEKNAFGNSNFGKGISVNNEFISANPTGPLTVGNGRGGFYGDSLARILRKAGFEVVNEYYINDAGGQIVKLGHSVLKDEEAIYSGEYIDKLGEKYAKFGDAAAIGKISADDILENIIKKTVSEKMQIKFNVWMSEKKLNDDGYNQRAIEMLKEKGLTFEEAGAVWLKTSAFGDDKDRVLIKKDGKNAYIAGDCGYMLNKIERGFNCLIVCLGADHHGYVSRLSAVAKALGFAGQFKVSISQLVRITKDGKEVRMSKRAGNVVYMDELIEEIGHDVARFFFLLYSPDTHMNFDLALAKEHSSKNPVFYVQYAHARICSILSKASHGTWNMEHGAKEKQECLCEGVITRSNSGCCQALDRHEFSSTKILAITESTQISNLKLLVAESEFSLVRELNKFPALIEEIANDYGVHKLGHYAIKLADKFHAFYGACKVIDIDNQDLTGARLCLINSARIVLAEVLALIGVDAPEKM